MQKQGFTLIEVLIVLTIMGIIVVAGYPSYQSYLREARRQDAIQSMQILQIAIENYIAQNNQLPAAAGITSSLSLISSSASGGTFNSTNQWYTLTYTASTNPLPTAYKANITTYTITATANAGTTQESDYAKTTLCSPLTLTSTKSGISPYACK